MLDFLSPLLQVPLISFLVNLVPAFAPPTWIVLCLYKISHPAFNSFLIAVLGVVGSVVGRFIMYYYSKFFGRFLPKKDKLHADYLKKIEKGKNWQLFSLTFLYSLSPLPSNFLFITSGITNIQIIPVLAGFAFGRLISYSLLVYGVFRTSLLLGVLRSTNLTMLVDVLGILASILIVLIDWRKLFSKSKKLKQ